MATRRGIFHWPSASSWKPSVNASKSSAASSARRISSRDSINMSALSLSFALLETFHDADRQILHVAHGQQIDVPQRIDDEVTDETEFVVSACGRIALDWLLE